MPTYEGSCHCGAVRHRVSMDPPTKAYACNCSICGRAGWLLAMVPAAQFMLTAGADALRDYQFGGRTLHHEFCTTCGVRPFSRGDTQVAVNLRCLADLPLADLPIETFDGASY